MFFVHLRDLSFIWPFREANTRNVKIAFIPVVLIFNKSYDLNST